MIAIRRSLTLPWFSKNVTYRTCHWQNRKYPADQWLIECGEFPTKPWYRIQDMAYQKGMIRDGYIGKCKYMFFEIGDVVGIYKEMIERNPYKLYGLEYTKANDHL